MDIRKVPISKVIPWEKNPRGIMTLDYERLKRQILKLGVYKPLVCCRENGMFVVLGGNMRIRALKELGVKEVEISVVEAKDEARKLELALSDNDRAGYYDETALAELLWRHRENLDAGLYSVDLGGVVGLTAILKANGQEPESREWYGGKTEGTGTVICPNCGAVVEE